MINRGFSHLASRHAFSPPTDSPKPCSGPTCSRRPSAPPSMPAPPSSVSVEQWLHVIRIVLPFQPPQPAFFLAEGQTFFSSDYIPIIYHPPRLLTTLFAC
jgi:hypothetical protein